MNKIIRVIIVIFTATIVMSHLTEAHAASLGDKAPGLQIKEWIKEEPVDLSVCFKTNIVVLEFWATWCPPCRASIAHLTELQKKYKEQGVIFIGISNEDTNTVKTFVDEMGDKMAYTVAVDQDGLTSSNYMTAFQLQGIPHAFIIDKEGRIAWSGHPMDKMEEAIDSLLAGTYDIDKAQKLFTVRQKMKDFFDLLEENKDEPAIEAKGKELEQLDREMGGIMPDGAKFDTAAIRKRVSLNLLLTQYQKAVTEDNTSKMEEIIGKIKTLSPQEFNVQQFQNDVRMYIAFDRYFKAITEPADDDKIDRLAKKLDELNSENAWMLNQYAWTLLTDKNIKKRDMEMALNVARKAYKACKGKDSAIVDTYARALYDNKCVWRAIRAQKKAIKLAEDEETKLVFTQTLLKYQGKTSGDGK